MNYDIIFYWLGVISAGLFTLLGMAVFSAYVMDVVWRKFKDGKLLADVISGYHKGKANE